MAILTLSGERVAVQEMREARLHQRMLVLNGLWAYSVIFDTQYHARFGFDIQTFFMVQHIPLYTVWFTICVLLAIHYIQSDRLGVSLVRRLPAGYWLAAAGAAGFGVAGFLDMVWHELIGFEGNLEVNYSPPHLILVGSAALASIGVLQHSLRHVPDPRAPVPSFGRALHLLIPLAHLLWLAMWSTWWSDPLTADYASGGAVVGGLGAFDQFDFRSASAQVAGTVGMLWNVALLVPFLVIPLHKWRLPPGSITFMVAFYSFIKATTTGTFIYLPALLGGALIGDILWFGLRRAGRDRRLSSFALIGAAVPFVQVLGYLATIAFALHGVIWPVHIWSGLILLTLAAGGLIGYLAVGGFAAPTITERGADGSRTVGG